MSADRLEPGGVAQTPHGPGFVRPVLDHERSHVALWARDVGVYSLARILAQAVALLSVPLFSRAFSTAEFGIIDTASALVALLTILSAARIPFGLQREYFDTTGGPSPGSLMATAVLVMIVTSAFAAILMATTAATLSDALFGSPKGTTALAWAALALPFGVVWLALSVALQSDRRATAYGAAVVAGAVANFLVSAVLVFAFDAGLGGFFAGTAVGAALTTAIAAVIVGPSLRRPCGVGGLRPILAVSLPTVPAAVMTWGSLYASRFVILGVGTTGMLGVFGIAGRVALLLSLIVGAVTSAWTPHVLRLFAVNRLAEAAFRVRATALYAYFLALAAGLLVTLTPEVVSLAAPDAYGDAAVAAPLLIVSVFITGLSVMMGTGLTLSRRVAWYSWAALLAITLNLGLTALLLAPLGVVGASIGAGAGSVALLFSQAWYGQRQAPVRWEWRRIVVCSLTLVGLGIAGTAMHEEPLSERLALGIALLLVMSVLAGGVAADWAALRSQVVAGFQRLARS